MIELIKNLDLFELLGINNLNSDEVKKITDDVALLTLTNAIDRLQNNPLNDESTSTQVKTIVRELEGQEDFTNKLIAQFPELSQFIIDETYLYKRNRLLDQLKEEAEMLVGELTPEETELRDAIAYLIDVIVRESNIEFDAAWTEYLSYSQSVE